MIVWPNLFRIARQNIMLPNGFNDAGNNMEWKINVFYTEDKVFKCFLLCYITFSHKIKMSLKQVLMNNWNKRLILVSIVTNDPHN